MKYVINKNIGKTLEMPVLVVDKLSQATEAAVRVVLYVIYNQTTESSDISAALSLSIDEVDKSLSFWCGAGLLSYQDETLPLPKIEEAQFETYKEIESLEQKKPDITTLVEECQQLFNESLSPAEIHILISLHENEKLPVDLILIGVTHFAQEGKRNMRYIERRLLNWKKEGINTSEEAERYFSSLEMEPEREQYVAALFDVEKDSLTATERKLIRAWYEDLKFEDEMIYQAYLRTGLNRSVRYMNGILRNWHDKNIRNPGEIEDKSLNIIPASTNIHKKDDYVAKKMYTIPTLKKKDE
jgi:DnaD and phage-associated domain